MSADEFSRPLWKRWLLNRFVLTFVILAVITIGWNLYVAGHDDGIVEGRVLDSAGRPVEGATVTLWTFNFTTFSDTGHTVSGPDGVFRFTKNPSHNIQVDAEKPGLGRSARIPIRLYFRGENIRLDKPLTLSGAA